MIKEFRQYLQFVKNYSNATVAGYCRDIKHFSRWAQQHIDDARWSTITRDDIDAYVTWRAENGKAPETTNRELSSISALYKYMRRQGLKVENPCKYESRRKLTETMPNTIPYNDLEKAYDKACGATRFLLGLLITTGMRIGEVLAMEWEDVDFSSGRIKVHGKGARERIVVTSQEVLTVAAEAHAVAHPTGKMWTISQRTARWMIYEALREHTNAPQLSPHAIRHTVATHLAQRGVNTTTIAQILGHKNVETTQRYINAAAIDASVALTNNNILKN